MENRIRHTKDIAEFQDWLKQSEHILYERPESLNLQGKEPIDKGFVCGISVWNEQTPLGVVALIQNKHLMYLNINAACMAFYECVDDAKISTLLLDSLCVEAKKTGCSYLIGPLNGSTWNSYRFAKTPIDKSFLSEVYHKPYYTKQLQQFGFIEISSYETKSDCEIKVNPDPRYQAIRLRTIENGIEIRDIRMDDFEMELEKLYKFCNNAFSNNFLFTPTTLEEFKKKYTAIKTIIDSECVLLAEENNELVAFFMGIPDYLEKEHKQMIYKTIAKKSGNKYAGLVHVMANILNSRVKEKNYTRVLHAFMHVSNKSVGVSNKFDSKTYREYGLYAKQL